MDGDLILPSILDEPIKVTRTGNCTIAAFLEREGIPEWCWDRLVVFLNGHPTADFDHVYLHPGDEITLAAIPAGGRNGKMALAAVATIVIAMYAGPLALAIPGIVQGTTAYYAATAGITLLGSLIISALIPPPSFSTSSFGTTSTSSGTEEASAYRVTGQSNQSIPYGQVPRVYGRIRVYPNLGSTPLITNIGKRSSISALYDFGLGNYEVSDVRIGNLPIETVEPNMRVLENSFGTGLKYVNKSVAYDQLAYTLEEGVWLNLRTKENASSAVVDLYFPRGLVRLDSNSTLYTHQAGFTVQYRAQGSTGSWKTVPSSWYKGATVSNPKFVYTAEYSDSDGDETYWHEYTYNTDAGNYRFVWDHWKDGAGIFFRRWKEEKTSATDFTSGGLTYRRGTSRAQESTDTESHVYYELLVPEAASGNITYVSEKTAVPFTVGVLIDFPTPGVWDIRVRRETEVTDNEVTNSLYDQTQVTLIKSYQEGQVVNLRARHTLMEFQYVANEKVSGVIQNINAICHSRLRKFNSSGFTGVAGKSANNAEVAIDLLTGDGARFPLTSSQIDWPSFVRLRNICNEKITQRVNGIAYQAPRFEWNGIISSDMTLKDALSMVLGPARAQLTLTTAGRYGVLIDEARTEVRQLITPANSWDFGGRRTFSRIPDGLRVNFLDEDRDWEPTTVVVYNDGFSSANAQTFEDLNTQGITSFPEAWRYGRYMMAQGILRSETFSVTMDIENLAVQRGDLVTVQHDLPLFGGLTVHVLEKSGYNVRIDETVTLSRGFYVLRSMTDGTIRSGRIVDQIDNDVLVFDNTSGMTPGALISLGTAEKVTRDYIVQGIEPAEELTASLTLTPYIPGVYDVDSATLPAWDPGFGEDIINRVDLQADIISVRQGWQYIDRVPYVTLVVKWTIPRGLATYYRAIVTAAVGNQDAIVISTDEVGTYEVTHVMPWNSRDIGAKAVITVTPYNAVGIPGEADSATITIDPYNLKPEAPTNFYGNVRSEEIHLRWTPSRSPDTNRYYLRYSPSVEGAQWHAAQQLGEVSWRVTEFSTGARTGTYMLRAVNLAGIMSDVVTTRTTIEDLPDINIITVLNDAPSWPGKLEGFTKGWTGGEKVMPVRSLDYGTFVVPQPPLVTTTVVRRATSGTVDIGVVPYVTDDTLVSSLTWNVDEPVESTYTFLPTFDLGAIYELRVQNRIVAYAFDNYEWAEDEAAAILARQRLIEPMEAVNVNVLGDDRNDEWDTWLEYRSIDEYSFISQWGNLSTISSMSQGTGEFGPWRKLDVGDATGRMFQFRIVATAYAQNIRIGVSDAEVELDMPDRVWRANDIQVPTAGVTVNYDPAFIEPPVLAITIEGATTAVRYQATNQTRTAVTVKLLNSAGTAVTGQIDVAALGYGRERSKGI